MKPLNKNVIISREEPKLTTESGIILKNPLDPDKALVKAIGTEVTEVSVGDLVMVDWNKTVEVDNNLFVIDVNEIVFIFEN